MSPSMNAEEELAYESRVKVRQAALAALAGVLIVGAAIIQLSGTHTKVEELTLDLITEHKRFPLDLVGAIINSFGLIALVVTLAYLFRISRARNREIAEYIRWLAIGGGALSAVSAVIYAVVIAGKADDFVNHGTQTYQQANHLTTGGVLVALPLIAQFASLLLTAGFVWVSLNAMRVGLLTRFMGYLGIFAGVLVLFPIGSPVPVVQGFWLLALAYLISGRWPSGLPAAWTTGQIERWPTNAELREQRDGGEPAKAKPGQPRPAKSAPVANVSDDDGASNGTARTRATTPKRKRKRRS
jgi:hypothetical protein